ncbi:MAG: transcription termination factor NusA [Acholeplasmataceae bacterium]|jgi:N utilization substance protein A|nr:transcription termination factor NusA [Acholeplasmataceae bacterium]MDD4194581.1 transcription termination factor NusA [Acholeplasmataceae bacterium]MDY0338466.1 transcription termination factor NusA [Acholeplasmataceae bacterium]
MISKEFFKNIELVAEEKELSHDQVVEAFVQGMIAGCKKAHDVRSCRVEIKEDKYEILVFTQHLVVDEYSIEADKNYTQILLEDAKKMNARAKVGDVIEQKIDPKDFGHFAVRDFKSRLNETLISMQKENLYKHFKSHEHEMINARVIDIADDHYRLDIGKDLTTLLPKKEALPKDNFHVGDHIRVYVSDVEMKTKWPKVFVSRAHPSLIIRLLENYIPEIKDGIIEIMGIAREPGDRTKIGVKSNDQKVDPIGACVGEGGSRIREIVKQLSDEKIDLFRWSDNEKELIANALQPAEVIAVTRVNPKEKTALAIVPDDQLSLAIGKLGQNVKLAVQACGWSIDIKSEQMAQGEGILY